MNSFLENEDILSSFDKELKETEESINEIKKSHGEGESLDRVREKRDQIKNSILNIEDARNAIVNTLDPMALSSFLDSNSAKAKIKSPQEPVNLPFEWLSLVYFKNNAYTFKAAKNFLKKDKGNDFKQKILNSSINYMTSDEVNITKKFANQSSEIAQGFSGAIQDEIKKLSGIAQKTVEIIESTFQMEEATKQVAIENAKFQEHENIIKGFQAKYAAVQKKKDAYFKVKELFNKFLEIVSLSLYIRTKSTI